MAKNNRIPCKNKNSKKGPHNIGPGGGMDGYCGSCKKIARDKRERIGEVISRESFSKDRSGVDVEQILAELANGGTAKEGKKLEERMFESGDMDYIYEFWSRAKSYKDVSGKFGLSMKDTDYIKMFLAEDTKNFDHYFAIAAFYEVNYGKVSKAAVRILEDAAVSSGDASLIGYAIMSDNTSQVKLGKALVNIGDGIEMENVMHDIEGAAVMPIAIYASKNGPHTKEMADSLNWLLLHREG